MTTKYLGNVPAASNDLVPQGPGQKGLFDTREVTNPIGLAAGNYLISECVGDSGNPLDVVQMAFDAGGNLFTRRSAAYPSTWSAWQSGGGGGGAVTSFNGRVGAVVPLAGDYTASQITNVPAGNITSTDVQAALNELDSIKQPLDAGLTALAALPGNGYVVQTGASTFINSSIAAGAGILVSDPTGVSGTNTLSVDPTGVVTSFNGRTGAVLPASADYTASQITNVPAGNITSTNVQAALNELDTLKQASSASLTALAALPGTGYVVQTGANSFVNRSISAAAGASSGLVIANGSGVAGATTVGLPAGVARDLLVNTGAGWLQTTTTTQAGQIAALGVIDGLASGSGAIVDVIDNAVGGSTHLIRAQRNVLGPSTRSNFFSVVVPAWGGASLDRHFNALDVAVPPTPAPGAAGAYAFMYAQGAGSPPTPVAYINAGGIIRCNLRAVASVAAVFRDGATGELVDGVSLRAEKHDIEPIADSGFIKRLAIKQFRFNADPNNELHAGAVVEDILEDASISVVSKRLLIGYAYSEILRDADGNIVQYGAPDYSQPRRINWTAAIPLLVREAQKDADRIAALEASSAAQGAALAAHSATILAQGAQLAAQSSTISAQSAAIAAQAAQITALNATLVALASRVSVLEGFPHL